MLPAAQAGVDWLRTVAGLNDAMLRKVMHRYVQLGAYRISLLPPSPCALWPLMPRVCLSAAEPP